jgi:hypothetical protein
MMIGPKELNMSKSTKSHIQSMEWTGRGHKTKEFLTEILKEQ